MKEKVLNFIIGMLIGAIIASAVFFIYSKVKGDTSNNQQQMQQSGMMGEPPSDRKWK